MNIYNPFPIPTSTELKTSNMSHLQKNDTTTLKKDNVSNILNINIKSSNLQDLPDILLRKIMEFSLTQFQYSKLPAAKQLSLNQFRDQFPLLYISRKMRFLFEQQVFSVCIKNSNFIKKHMKRIKNMLLNLNTFNTKILQLKPLGNYITELHLTAYTRFLDSGSFHNGTEQISYRSPGNFPMNSETFAQLCIVCPNLEKFTPPFTITTPDIHVLNRLTQLKELNLQSCYHCNCPNNKKFPLYIDALKLPNLKKLSLHRREEINDNQLILILTQCPQLNSLNLLGTSITDKSLIAITRTAGNLEHLNLSNCDSITNTGIQILQDLKFLHVLNILYCSKITSDAMTSLLQYKTLRTVYTDLKFTMKEPVQQEFKKAGITVGGGGFDELVPPEICPQNKNYIINYADLGKIMNTLI